MSNSRRFEILLPLKFNDGQPVPWELIGETLQELKGALAPFRGRRRPYLVFGNISKPSFATTLSESLSTSKIA